MRQEQPLRGATMVQKAALFARRSCALITSVLRRCLSALICCLPVAASADAWDMFVARCLDPYEHLSLEIIGNLPEQPIDQMHDARRVYGPTDEGYLLVLDDAPVIGERACAVEATGEPASGAAKAWVEMQLASGRYREADNGWLVSHEWIEPRLMVRVQSSAARTSFAVVETDLES